MLNVAAKVLKHMLTIRQGKGTINFQRDAASNFTAISK